MNNYNFEEFESVGTRYSMFITLGKSERFYLGSSFCRKYDIASKEAVKLLFDKSKKAVGFKFLTSKEEGSIDLKKLQDDSYYINAKAFLGMYDITPAEKWAGRYEPKEIMSEDGSKIFVIDLVIDPKYQQNETSNENTEGSIPSVQ